MIDVTHVASAIAYEYQCWGSEESAKVLAECRPHAPDCGHRTR